MANPMMDYLKNGKSKKKKGPKESSESAKSEKGEKNLSPKMLKKAEAEEVG